MLIKILGNGGAINTGLPYNSFIVDNTLLCETPPDIMISLRKHRILPTKIDTIFISHFHADHYFGLPFLILDIFSTNFQTKANFKLRVFGPNGIKRRSREIIALAFGEQHPCLHWMLEIAMFYEINENVQYSLVPGTVSKFYSMNHFTETYGFIYSIDDIVEFAYIPDTLWNQNIEKILNHKPKHVLIDLGGEENDPVPVHLSEHELSAMITKSDFIPTLFWGTHLKCNKISKTDRLQYVKAGIEIQTDT